LHFCEPDGAGDGAVEGIGRTDFFADPFAGGATFGGDADATTTALSGGAAIGVEALAAVSTVADDGALLTTLLATSADRPRPRKATPMNTMPTMATRTAIPIAIRARLGRGSECGVVIVGSNAALPS